MAHQFLLFADMGIEHKAGDDLHNGCAGDTEADIEQPPRRAAHPPGYRNADQKGRRDALHHDKARLAESVEKADEAEQKTGQQAVDSVGPQIVKARRKHPAPRRTCPPPAGPPRHRAPAKTGPAKSASRTPAAAPGSAPW